jgi:hypothetical protein
MTIKSRFCVVCGMRFSLPERRMIDAQEIVAENIAIALGNDPNLDVPSPFPVLFNLNAFGISQAL